MPGGPDRGERGRDPVVARRSLRLATVFVILLALAATAALAFDHRRADLGDALLALSDGRSMRLDSGGGPGPRSLLLMGRSAAQVRHLPPVLANSTSVAQARRPGGFAASRNGWLLLRLGELGHDTEGGQITEVSPDGQTLISMPLLQWRDAAVIGVTDQGLAVFRLGTTVSMLGPEGEALPLIHLRDLGVASDLSNLAGVALADDGRLAVLTADASDPSRYLLFVRRAGGGPHHVVPIPRSALIDAHPAAIHPAVAFDGADIVVAGSTGLVRWRSGHLLRSALRPAIEERTADDPPSMVIRRDGGAVIGHSHLRAVDRSGRVRTAGYGPCPPEPEARLRCPAVLDGRRVPGPSTLLPDAAAGMLAVVALGLAWAGRAGRHEAPRLRLTATVICATWITGWLLVSLIWGELHGSMPLLLLGGVTLAVLAPAYPVPAEAEVDASEPSGQTSWVTDRIGGPVASGRGPRRLEVIPLPSRS